MRLLNARPFPNPSRFGLAFFSRLSLLFAVVVLAAGCASNRRPPSVYLIPEGYEGWVQIAFGYDGAPEIPVEDGKEIFEIGADGHLNTSTPKPSYGIASDEYYAVNEEGTRLPIDSNQKIHFQTVGSRTEGSEPDSLSKIVVVEFFVGDSDRVGEYPKPTFPRPSDTR